MKRIAVRDLELPLLTFALASFDAWLIIAKSLFQQVPAPHSILRITTSGRWSLLANRSPVVGIKWRPLLRAFRTPGATRATSHFNPSRTTAPVASQFEIVSI